jgi:hypothetical protein
MVEPFNPEEEKLSKLFQVDYDTRRRDNETEQVWYGYGFKCGL